MKKLVLVFMLLFSFNCFAETIVLNGNITDAQREACRVAYFERLKNSEELVNAEIQRKHELDIEVAKFKNALMLERASASNISVYSSSASRNELSVNQNVNQNTGTIKNKE